MKKMSSSDFKEVAVSACLDELDDLKYGMFIEKI